MTLLLDCILVSLQGSPEILFQHTYVIECTAPTKDRLFLMSNNYPGGVILLCTILLLDVIKIIYEGTEGILDVIMNLLFKLVSGLLNYFLLNIAYN